MPDIIEKRTQMVRKDGEYKLPDLQHEVACPSCENGVLSINRIIYHLPDGDDIIIMTMECPRCQFRRNDMIPLKSAFKPGKFILTVDDGDLDHKIFRGMSGNLEIPEVGVSIERGPAASFVINNLEGLLIMMRNQVEFYLTTISPATPEWQAAAQSLDRLNGCLARERPFTLILEDPNGGSYIVPSKPEKLRFIESEAAPTGSSPTESASPGSSPAQSSFGESSESK